ncbi:MAG: hypothetical protein U0Q16_10445 [Bryobacteraceae bacterium]
MSAVAQESTTVRFLRIVPLGGMRGTTVTVEVIGEKLEAPTSVWFDTQDLEWAETIEAMDKKVRGRIRIAPGAALGPHIMRLRTKSGPTNSRLFHVNQFPSVDEAEPNDIPVKAQAIDLKPQVLHGYLNKSADLDYYAFEARAGERWTFDLRSLERGGFLECELAILDERGKQIAFNDDRDDYLETPFIEHVFRTGGKHFLKVDQYRGPQGVTCGSNCGYMLEMSQLPVVESVSPLGARVGSKLELSIDGRALDSVTEVHLAAARAGEYYRLTFPFSIPLRAGPDRQQRIDGRIVRKAGVHISAQFEIPGGAPAGLYRLWLTSPQGVAEGMNLEIDDVREGVPTDWYSGEFVINGLLAKHDEQHSWTVEAKKGKPLHFWTLAAQLGLPQMDTVLELLDEAGKLVADHDDLMTGQGTVIGNPDSSLYYTPKKDQRLRLVVRDRIGRGGPGFAYRLHVKSEEPGFQLITEPEEFTIPRGGEAELSALLIRQPGFEGAVDVWVEGLPSGAEAGRGAFRAGQFFGPSGDGDNVIIPEARLKIRVPNGLELGEYPIRVVGRASGGPLVEAFTTLWIGPRGKRNDVRRPMPAITMTVVDQATSSPSAQTRTSDRRQ